MVLHRTYDADDGFSLAEVLVALMIVTGSILAMIGTALFAVQATVSGRQNQQAADYANTAIEELRSLDYSAVTMKENAALASDPAITGSGATRSFDPGVGTGAELLDIRPVGAVDPHVQTVTGDNGTYTVRRYVTVPTGTPTNAQGIPSVRRVTVVVTWDDKGRTRTRTAGTTLTDTRRGLPLPNYTWTYNGPATVVGTTPTQTVAPGADVSFGFVLRNLGARDSWALSAPAGWTWYRDTDQDGLWSEDVTTEPALLPLPASTGLLEPSAEVHVVAYRVAPSTTGTTSLTFRASSEGQPTVPGKTVVGSMVVQTTAVTPPTPTPTATPTPPGNCNPGTATSVAADSTSAFVAPNRYTAVRILLFNGPGTGDTVTAASNTMGTDPNGLQPALCNWSTDLQTDQAGRRLNVGTTGTQDVAEWRFQPPSNAQDEFAGTAAVVLFVQCPSTTPTLTVSLLTQTGTSAPVSAVSDTVTPSGCVPGSFVRVERTLTLTSALNLNRQQDRLVLRVTSSQPVRLAYGTSGAQSRLTIGTK